MHGSINTPEAPGQPVKRASRRRVILIAAVVIVVVAVGGTLFVREQLKLDDPVIGVTAVAVRDNSFAPESVQVPVGATITWTWEGKEKHNVVGDDFESPTQSEGTFTQTFAAPGTFDYECTLHLFMRGQVVVTE
jgi:plastocyanin